ncbi:amino acid ABC transporter substrate-binding protein, PAAT family [Desulfobulbus propionicus DSM 2032]|uniref:Amino acid ABC transporter substrate-binding protein, PAAT family n=1 Tax=Desulfobulbus propionicus (strain ATCC 33891 / DSM 2032 / VKM B-1956 / 1pr3) TaxID=577650 RepID=A0A7U4DQL5_DESPD|nr:transporter substrate-binding domain-containing protein [Desulfobulbus propionicus]ADW19224.1 amino acid ABC transporter substrate-binding protein, PAAT family [Desulfobulbus propionicus DSM 2032]
MKRAICIHPPLATIRKWLGTLLLVAVFAVSSCAAEQQGPLKVGMELAYPPFEMTNTTGKPAGVSVDLAKALGISLGREIKIENMSFDGLIPALKTGKIDIILSSMTATAERAQSIDFSEPYLQTGLCLLVRKDSAVQTIADLDQDGMTVAVKKGTTGHNYASKALKKAKLLVLDKEAAAVLEVVQGKADAFIYDQMSTYSNWKRNPQTTRALLKPFQQESWAIGIRKDNTALKEEINRFLKDYRAKGGFDKLGDTWLLEQKQEFKRLGYPFFL